MSKKNKKTLYYAEIRICGFDNKQKLIAAVEDAVEQIGHYVSWTDPVSGMTGVLRQNWSEKEASGDANIEVEFEKLDYANAGADWLPMKTPKKIRKVIGEA